MAADNFIIKIFTPQGQLAEDVSSGARLPASDGEIGVLPQHAKYVALLGTGILEYQTHPAGVLKKLAVCGGICTFQDDLLTVMADRAATPEAARLTVGLGQREELLEILSSGTYDDPEAVSARAELEYLDAIEKVAGR